MTDLLAFQPTPTDLRRHRGSAARRQRIIRATLIVSTHQALLGVDGATGCVTRMNHGRGHTTASRRRRRSASRPACCSPARSTGWRSPCATRVAPAADALLPVDPAARRVRGHRRLPTQYLHDSRCTRHLRRRHGDRLRQRAAHKRRRGGDARFARRSAVRAPTRLMMSHINNAGFGAGGCGCSRTTTASARAWSRSTRRAARQIRAGRPELPPDQPAPRRWCTSCRRSVARQAAAAGGAGRRARRRGAPVRRPALLFEGPRDRRRRRHFGVARKQAPPTEGEASAAARGALDRNAAAAELVAYDPTRARAGAARCRSPASSTPSAPRSRRTARGARAAGRAQMPRTRSRTGRRRSCGSGRRRRSSCRLQ